MRKVTFAALFVALVLLAGAAPALASGVGYYTGDTYWYHDYDTGLSFRGFWVGDTFWSTWSDGTTLRLSRIGDTYWYSWTNPYSSLYDLEATRIRAGLQADEALLWFSQFPWW